MNTKVKVQSNGIIDDDVEGEGEGEGDERLSIGCVGFECAYNECDVVEGRQPYVLANTLGST